MTEPYRCSVCESDDPAVRNFVSMPGATGFAQRRCTHESHGTVQHGTVPHDLTGPTPERMSEDVMAAIARQLEADKALARQGKSLGYYWLHQAANLFRELTHLREREEKLEHRGFGHDRIVMLKESTDNLLDHVGADPRYTDAAQIVKANVNDLLRAVIPSPDLQRLLTRYARDLHDSEAARKRAEAQRDWLAHECQALDGRSTAMWRESAAIAVAQAEGSET